MHVFILIQKDLGLFYVNRIVIFLFMIYYYMYRYQDLERTPFLLCYFRVFSSPLGGIAKWKLLQHWKENGTEPEKEWNKTEKKKQMFRRKIKYMNFVDTTVYKGKEFETKLNLDFKSDIEKKPHVNIWTLLVLTFLQFSRDSLKGNPFVIWDIQTTLVNLKKRLCEFNINLIYKS